MILEPEFLVNKGEIHVSGETIRLRITPNMKKWLFDKAANENTSVSNIMGNLISEEMSKK